MSIASLLVDAVFLGIGLAMDAFAVSICKGLAMTKVNKKQAVILGTVFGAFQAAMPLLGWFLGTRFETYIKTFDHWIAFALLLFIGGKMLLDAIKGSEDEDNEVKKDQKLDPKELVIMGIATSIDAMAAGIAFAAQGYTGGMLATAILIIGILTFAICYGGVFVGNIFGHKYEKKAQIAGGIVLIGIGVKILIEHLFF